MSAFNEKERQAYVQGYDEGKKYAEGVAKIQLASILNWFLEEPPCETQIADKFIDCDWCEENCGEVSNFKCWKYAIDKGWIL